MGKNLREGAGAQVNITIRDYELEVEDGEVFLYGADVELNDYENSLSSSEDGYGELPFRVGKIEGLSPDEIPIIQFDDDIGGNVLRISEGFGWTSPKDLPTFTLGVYYGDDPEEDDYNELGEVKLIPSEELNWMYHDVKDHDELLEESVVGEFIHKSLLREGSYGDQVRSKEDDKPWIEPALEKTLMAIKKFNGLAKAGRFSGSSYKYIEKDLNLLYKSILNFLDKIDN